MNAPVDITNVRIETERLILRPWQESDLQDFYEYASVPGVGEMAGWSAHKSIEESKTILNIFMTEKKTFAIELKETGKVIGSLGLEEADRVDAGLEKKQGREIGYVLSKDYWGRGLMPEAVKAVIDHCFRELKFDWLTCGHFVWNHQSRRVVEKCGFVYMKDIIHRTRFDTEEATKLYILHNHVKNMTAPIDVTDIRIETERLILRPVCQEDFPELHHISTTPEIAQFDGWLVSQSEEDTRKRLDKAIASKEELALVLKETGKMAGTFALQVRDWRTYPIDRNLKGREFGFDLMKEYWGRGLMSEAVKAVTDYCFRELHYDFLTGGYFTGNHQSLRVLEKCGYQFLFEDVRTMPYGKDVTIRTHIKYKE